MNIIIVENQITWAEVRKLAEESYGEMVKAVADINLGILAIGGEFHADGEQLLLAKGSRQVDLWGFNIYPDNPADSILIYDSLINIRPKDNNRSTEIQLPEIRKKIFEIFEKIVL
ncbi:MAG: DUF5674 family protein [Candidatus Buchananbacteria bacterium]|jgi:hypothetical protein